MSCLCGSFDCPSCGPALGNAEACPDCGAPPGHCDVCGKPADGSFYALCASCEAEARRLIRAFENEANQGGNTMTLIDWIEGAMLSDDENREHQSDLLQRLYRHADKAQQNALDAALICICGWTFAHALKMAASTAAETEGT